MEGKKTVTDGRVIGLGKIKTHSVISMKSLQANPEGLGFERWPNEF